MLPTAEELRRTTEEKKNTAAQRAHDTALHEIEAAIRAAHQKGHDTVYVLPPPDSVVLHLRAQGYRVSDRHKGAGMGDCDTVEITWRA